MKLKRMALCVASALSLIGCANVAHQGAPTSSYRFDYKMAQRADGVIRAFDDGRQAIVQFVDLEKSRPMFAGEDGNPIEYEIRGQYALLPTIISRFKVKTTAGVASFDYTGSALVVKEKSLVVTDPAAIAPRPVTTSSEKDKPAAFDTSSSSQPVATGTAAAVATPVTTSSVEPKDAIRGAALPVKKEEGARTSPTEAVQPATAEAKAPTQTFAVLPSDTLLIPLLVRWAEAGALVPVLNGRQVTSATLNAQARADLPLSLIHI